ncbi:MAG: tetratricopeptide repeat protein [Bacteroidales bacterium]|nr:tetratricopeptide repeat protein [Bacteroidales bacterium]MCF8389921.1 tetratricopeptide repeat protein [Bacteroidales bacterium]
MKFSSLFLSLLVFFSLLTVGINGQAANNFTSLNPGDSLYPHQNYVAAYDFYKKELSSDLASGDSVYRAELYLRLCQIAEELEQYTNAVSFHLEWRYLMPFQNQAENQRYIDKVAQLLPAATDSLGLTRLYYRYGLLLTREANREKACEYFLRALKLANKIQNYAAVATISNDLAGEYWDAGEKDLSTSMYQESIRAAKILNDSNRIAGAYLNLAGNYIDEGDFKTGIPIHLEALKIKESLTDKTNLSFYYLQTASVYHQVRNFENWEKYILKAYQIRDCEVCTPLLERATLYTEMGGIAKYKGQIQEAIQYYDTVLSISKEIAFLNGMKNAYDNKALIYKDLGDYKKALEMINQSEAFLTDNPFQHISHNNAKAELLQHLNKPVEALVLLKKNFQNESLSNYAEEKLRTFRLLYEVNIQLSFFQDAFRWNDSLRNLENTLRDTEVRKEMANLETRYQTEKKEQQINLLTAENKIKNQRIRSGWMFIGLLILLIGLVLILLYFRRKQSIYKESELKQQLLRSQMNPHFIFNVLGSIQSFLYKNESGLAADYLSKFASMIRSVLEFSSEEKINLNDEISMLKNYIELERLRVEKPFDVEYIIDPEMETDFIEIPPMIIQPFVENAIKHGLQNLKYPGRLTIKFEEKPYHIAVELIDNGSGLSINKNKNHKSKAMDIFMQRKKGIEHKFKKSLSFEFQNLKDIDPSKQGVRVFIELPILNND